MPPVEGRTTALACTVRECGRPLVRTPRAWSCDAGHAFDVARSGYVNLLQPQDRRSRRAGDAAEAIAARARLVASGVGTLLMRRVAEALGAPALAGPARADRMIVELGCGSGEFLGHLVASDPSSGIGIDLSTAAVDLAARHFPALTWVAANADRRLPLLDNSIDFIVSVHARRNPPECARVLRPNGVLIVVVPAADDLIELRTAVLGPPVERDRAAAAIDEHREHFVLLARSECREQPTLSESQLSDLLTGTYRGARHATDARRAALAAMPVTLASHILLFRPC